MKYNLLLLNTNRANYRKKKLIILYYITSILFHEIKIEISNRSLKSAPQKYGCSQVHSNRFQSNLGFNPIKFDRFDFYNFFETKLNSFMIGLDQRVTHLNLIFFLLLRTTILCHDSSTYSIQLTQYYQMSKSNKINSFNTINIIF